MKKVAPHLRPLRPYTAEEQANRSLLDPVGLLKSRGEVALFIALIALTFSTGIYLAVVPHPDTPNRTTPVERGYDRRLTFGVTSLVTGLLCIGLTLYKTYVWSGPMSRRFYTLLMGVCAASIVLACAMCFLGWAEVYTIPEADGGTATWVYLVGDIAVSTAITSAMLIVTAAIMTVWYLRSTPYPSDANQ